MLNEGTTIDLGENLRRSLFDFRRRLWRNKFAEALLASVCGLALAFLLIYVVDRFAESPPAARACVSLLGAIGFGLFLPLTLHRWIWKTRRAEQVARVVMHKLPATGEQILGAVELAANRGNQHSARLAEAAIKQVNDWIPGQDLNSAAPVDRVRLWAAATSMALLLTVGALALTPGAAFSSLWRLVNPWTSTPRYTFVQLVPLPKEMTVAFAEPFSLEVSLAENASWKPATAQASISKVRRTGELTQHGNYAFELPGQTLPTVVTVQVGDATARVRVVPTARPELLKLSADVELPAYLERTAPLRLDSSRGNLAAVKGSKLSVSLEASRELRDVKASGVEASVAGATVKLAPMEIEADRRVSVAWTDRHGLSQAQPIALRIHANDDEPPLLQCSGLAADQVVLASETLQLNASASDDFGLRRIGLEWQGDADALADRQAASGERTVVAGGPDQRQLSGTVAFSPATEKISSQTIQLRMFAEDYLPNRPRIYSPSYVIHVMSQDDHAAWIAEQLRRWQSKADAVYEQELRLLEQNRELRLLAQEEAVRPELLRKLEQQAADERANAKDLAEATKAGTDLSNQAVKNESIRSDQLNRWAGGLQRLRDIAGKEMPSIADELTRLSQASLSPGADKSGAIPTPSTEEQPPQHSEVAGVDRRPATGTAPEAKGESEDEAQEAPPQIVDRESTLTPPAANQSTDEQLSAGSGNSLGIPETSLGPAASKTNKNSDDKKKERGDANEADAKESIDDLVQSHVKLIEEFRKAREELNALTQDFENSTFVKRLKAASRNQLQLAQRINRLVASDFGVDAAESNDDKTVLAELADAQAKQSRFVGDIREDLAASQNRTPKNSVKAVLQEMEELNMQVKIDEMPLRLQRNLTGDALHRSEFWSDTFDRWAEELVGPSQDQDNEDNDQEDSEQNHLPPAVLVEIMRIIHGEIDLRDQTRAVAQIGEATDRSEYEERTTGLAVGQMSLQERALDVISDIEALPSGGERFDRELGKLRSAVTEMEKASELLVDLKAGAATLAAESQAIEALLASRRQSDKVGKGSGSDGGGAGSLAGGRTNRSPLELIGPDEDAGAYDDPRDVGAATGTAGAPLPEQYREGLDAFQNGLHRLRQRP